MALVSGLNVRTPLTGFGFPSPDGLEVYSTLSNLILLTAGGSETPAARQVKGR